MKIESEIKRWERLTVAGINRRLEMLPPVDVGAVDALVTRLFRSYMAKENERISRLPKRKAGRGKAAA